MMFLNAVGIPGLLSAALELIAMHGFINYSELGARLGIASATVRSRVQSLWAAGMLLTIPNAAVYRPTERAKVFLKMCSLLRPEQEIGPELAFILARLGLSSHRGPISSYTNLEERIADHGGVEIARRRSLMFEIVKARENFGMPISGGPYFDEDQFHPKAVWIGR
jgi:hypothetical protein